MLQTFCIIVSGIQAFENGEVGMKKFRALHGHHNTLYHIRTSEPPSLKSWIHPCQVPA